MTVGRFGKQRSERGEEGMEESDAEESTMVAPCKEPGDKYMDQGHEGGSDEDEESDSTEATLEGSCSPSSQGSKCSSHHYSSGYCTSGVNWASQYLSEDDGSLMSGVRRMPPMRPQKKMMGRNH